MKKIIIATSILLLAAGCSKQPTTVINYPTPTPTVSATPTPDAAASWQTYTSIPYSFEFQYPQDFGFNQVTNSYLSDAVVQLEPIKNNYPGTNYADSSFGVSTGFAKDASACLVGQQTKKPLTQTKVVNGVTFYEDTYGGAAAGNFYDSTLYRTLRGNLCVEVSLTIHTANIANFEPGTVTEIDPAKPMAVLLQMLETFKFTK